MFPNDQALRRLALAVDLWVYGFCPLVKLMAYVCWCRWGRGLLRSGPEASAWKFGIIRFVIGLFVGVWTVAALRLLGPDRVAALGSFAVYAAAFVPIRWVEWWLVERMMTGRPASLLPATRGELIWLAGGTIVSFLADAPLLWGVGFLFGIA